MPIFIRIACTVFLSSLFSADQRTLDADRPLFQHAVQLKHNAMFIRVAQTPGPRLFTVAGRHKFEIPGGADVTVNNPETRDGESFCEVGILHEDNEGCSPSCESCSFFFVIAFNIEPGSGSTKSNDDFYKYWHGDNGDSTITWSESGAGGSSGWGGINDTPNPDDSIDTHSSEMRFTVDESVMCGDSKTITFTASSTVAGTAPVTVTLTLDCGVCVEVEQL